MCGFLGCELLHLQDGIEEGEGVTICTIHAAKGLEWDYVFVPQLIDKSLPLEPSCSQASMSPEAWLTYQEKHEPPFGRPKLIKSILHKWRAMTPPRSPSEVRLVVSYCGTLPWRSLQLRPNTKGRVTVSI